MDALTPPPSFKSWVPQCIADTVRWHFDSYTRDIQALKAKGFGALELCEITQNAETILDRFYRLASRSGMQCVWERLSKATPKSGSIESFLTEYVRIASYPGQPEAFWNTVQPLNEQRERLDEIVNLATQLSRKLGPIIPFPTFIHTAWNTLSAGTEALIRDAGLRDKHKELIRKLQWLQRRNPDVHVGNGADAELPWVIGPQFALSGLDTELKVLAELARLSKICLKKLPKGGARRFTRVTIRSLGRLVDQTLAEPHHEEIATTVSVSLALDPPLDNDYVRKIRNPPRVKT